MSGQELQLQMVVLVDCFDGGTPHEQEHGQEHGSWAENAAKWSSINSMIEGRTRAPPRHSNPFF